MTEKAKHPGVIFKETYIDPVPFSVMGVAKILEIEVEELKKIIAGEADISPWLAKRFESDYGGTKKGWLKLQREYNNDETTNKSKRV